MGKIINRSNINVVYEDDSCVMFSVIRYLRNTGHDSIIYEKLSDLVRTMTGDAVTPFNTIGEMIRDIPNIINCEEECSVLEVFSNKGIDWFILGWSCEEDVELANKILNTYYKNFEVVE